MKLPRWFALLALVVWPVAAPAATTRLTAANRQRVESPAHVEMLRSMREVPADVARACAAVRGGEFILADPGQRYRATDVVYGHTDNLPVRRLRWAARVPGFYVLHYEMGGIGHSYHVRLVRVGEGVSAATARLVWSAVGNSALKDYSRFVAALRAGQLDDNPAYIH